MYGSKALVKVCFCFVFPFHATIPIAKKKTQNQAVRTEIIPISPSNVAFFTGNCMQWGYFLLFYVNRELNDNKNLKINATSKLLRNYVGTEELKLKLSCDIFLLESA